jgi:hypothetical protein
MGITMEVGENISEVRPAIRSVTAVGWADPRFSSIP